MGRHTQVIRELPDFTSNVCAWLRRTPPHKFSTRNALEQVQGLTQVALNQMKTNFTTLVTEERRDRLLAVNPQTDLELAAVLGYALDSAGITKAISMYSRLTGKSWVSLRKAKLHVKIRKMEKQRVPRAHICQALGISQGLISNVVRGLA
jgi:hypothetical protein